MDPFRVTHEKVEAILRELAEVPLNELADAALVKIVEAFPQASTAAQKITARLYAVRVLERRRRAELEG